MPLYCHYISINILIIILVVAVAPKKMVTCAIGQLTSYRRCHGQTSCFCDLPSTPERFKVKTAPILFSGHGSSLGWLVVWNMAVICPYSGNNHPNFHICQTRGWNHQPVGYWFGAQCIDYCFCEFFDLVTKSTIYMNICLECFIYIIHRYTSVYINTCNKMGNTMEYQTEHQMGNTIEYPGLTGEIKVVEWAMGRFLGFQDLDNSTYPSFCIPVQWGLRSAFPRMPHGFVWTSAPDSNGFVFAGSSFNGNVHFWNMVYHVPWYLDVFSSSKSMVFFHGNNPNYP